MRRAPSVVPPAPTYSARQLVPENLRVLQQEMRDQIQALRANVAELLGRKTETQWRRMLSGPTGTRPGV